MKKIYLVLSQTYSGVSKTIKIFTKEKYSHASISLDLKFMPLNIFIQPVLELLVSRV